MQSRLPFAFAMIALIGLGAALAPKDANAQPPGPPTPDKEKHGSRWNFSPADRAAWVDARIAALHAGLKLTADQEKLWPPLEAALRAGQKGAVERREKMRSEPPPADIIAKLRRMSEAQTARGGTLKAIADAAAPLYATLTDEQKHRLPFLLHAFKPHSFIGHFRGMGGMGGQHGWRRHDDAHDGGYDDDDNDGSDDDHPSGQDDHK
jgi:hypothetical protein